MGNNLKYEIGAIIYNGKGKYLGVIVDANNSPGILNTTNRYELELTDGTRLPLDEHQIRETKWHKDKE